MDPSIDLLPALILAVLLFAGTIASATMIGVLKRQSPNRGPVHLMEHEDPLGAIRMIELVMLCLWIVSAVHLYGTLVSVLLAFIAFEFLRSSTARAVIDRYVAPIGIGRFARIGLFGTAFLAVSAMAVYMNFAVR